MSRHVDPIVATLPYDSELPPGRQRAYVATVRVLVPCVDRHGTTVRNEVDAADYIAETLREQFLDWSYVGGGEAQDAGPAPVTVSEPYIEGTFAVDDASA